MSSPTKKTDVTEMISRHKFTPIKRYGQNFLTDSNILSKIADAADLSEQDTVIEIGAGLGALTLELAKRANRVIALEIDDKIIPLLREFTINAENIEIIKTDVLEYDVPFDAGAYVVVGNLPYYITTPVIMKFVLSENLPRTMVFMIQKEVAQRLTANPGGRDYGAVSVAVQYRCKTEYVADISKEVFFPKPKVDSAIIRLSPSNDLPKAKDEKVFTSIVRAGFGQRRKMLRNSLKTAGYSSDVINSAFEISGIPGTARPEQLSPQEFIKLADAVCEYIDEEIIK